MARITSVGFETDSGPNPGLVPVPRRVVDFLHLRESDPVEGRATFEGRVVEFVTVLDSDLCLRVSMDVPESRPLGEIPANSELTVVLWYEGADDPSLPAGLAPTGDVMPE